jgi:hypothetical protein
MRNALIEVSTGLVVNVIELGSDGDWNPPEGCETVPTSTGGIGDSYANGVFTPAPAPRKTKDQLLLENQQKLQELKNSASQAMSPLLLIMQLGGASDAEVASAKAWQDYYRSLQLVDLTIADPEWPTIPA